MSGYAPEGALVVREGRVVAASTKGGYLFDNAWEGEDERLAGIEAAFDPATRRHLSAIGLDEGWRCLEVGAGSGSVARWLAERVGPKGRVLATDINTKLLEGLDLENLEVRQHDITRDDLPEGEFDLVHSRLVLEHLPGREEALAKMASALAPGGWLVVEDLQWSGMGAASKRGAILLNSLMRGLAAMLKRAGHDGRFGRRLPVLFQRLGLVEVGAEGRAIVLVGGTPSVEWARPSLERIRNLLLGTDEEGPADSPVRAAFERLPALRRLAAAQFDKVDTLLEDPEFAFVAPVMMTAWGRRPA